MINNIFENPTDEERNNQWMYAIFNKDEIKAKTEQWTKEAEEAGMTLTEYLGSISPLNNKEYEAEVITRGNCMICGKELTEGLFFCKECEAKATQSRRQGINTAEYKARDKE